MNIEQFIDEKDLTAKIHAMPLDSKLYVAGVPNNTYHASRGWSSSHAKKAYQSEQRLYRYLQKQDDQDGTEDHYVFGELTHDSVRLSATEISGIYCDDVQLPDGRTNLGKALKQCMISGSDDITSPGFNLDSVARRKGKDLLDSIDGRTVVSKTAVDEARALADAILNQQTVKEALGNHKAIYELSIWHKMPDGFIRKCRPDCYLPEPAVIFDWKTAREIVWTYSTDDRHTFVKHQLMREIDKRDYALSAAWYMDILGIVEYGAFMLVFADKDALEVYPPYLFDVERLLQETSRCYDAIKSIKSMSDKLVEGKIVTPLTTFLPNDKYIFSGQQKEYM